MAPTIITDEKFGENAGRTVDKYTLKNDNVQAEILTYGAIVRSLKIKDKNGVLTDVVLGFDNLDGYIADDCYMGALIGRVCNRTENAAFTLDGKTYSVGKNEEYNSLHGGFYGFNTKIYDAEIDGEKLILSSYSLDGEEGYPSDLIFAVIYSLAENGLIIEYFAQANGKTPLNLTNHTYFNLNGGKYDIQDTKVRIFADKITPVNQKNSAHGYMSVDGTPFDFRKEKSIKAGIDDEKNSLIKFCGGYDINYVLKGAGMREAATAYDERSGICFSVKTDREGMQFYTGNFITEKSGKSGRLNKKRMGFCFETQGFPNALNNIDYPSIILEKDKVYHSRTEYLFSVK